MKYTLLIGSLALFLGGCAQNSENIVYEEAADDASSIVCGQFGDGQKQTFPSLEELSKVKDAVYLHDGPCYEN